MKFQNLLVCPWNKGQDKQGVEDGAYMLNYLIADKIKVQSSVLKYTTSCELYSKLIYDSVLNFSGNNIIVGGDHSISIGTALATINRTDKKSCVIWIDAHPDINTLNSSFTGNIHGMPLSFITGLENSWKWTKHVQKLDFKDLYYFGIRDIDPFETDVIFNKKITVLNNIDEIINVIKKYDNIHISFDVDSLDPSYMFSTGTKSENGIEISEINDLFKEIHKFNNKNFNIDIVEFNPYIGNEHQKSVSINNLNIILNSLFELN